MPFKDPWILALLPIAAGILLWLWAREKDAALRFSSVELAAPLKSTWRVRMSAMVFALRLAAAVLMVIALAGPRLILEETEYTSEGIDIVLAVDASGSMEAEDFELDGQRVNRLDVVKRVAEEFIDMRRSDRIGLVAFGGRAYTVSPLTTDYEWLKTNLQRVVLNLVEDQTAVGSAIGSALSRLRKSDAKSKVIILLTDGANNAGKLDPLTAAQAAKAMGVKIYTIGAGTKGYVPFPVRDLWGRKIYRNVIIDMDEKLLQEIARTTGGKFYLATDTKSLREIYREIDSLEKTRVQEQSYRQYREMFVYFLTAALGLLAAEIFLNNAVLSKVP